METTPPFTSRSKSVLVLSLVSLLVKGGECGELVLPSLPPLVRSTENRDELICGTTNKGRQHSSAGVVSVESEGGEQGGGRGSLPVNVKDSVCSEPHLEVDREEEPK